MDYIAVLTTGAERTTVVRPIVEFMQRNLAEDTPELSFVYTDEEYVRITPGQYELCIHWYPGLQDTWFIDRLHLKSPNKFDTVNQTVDLMGPSESYPFLAGIEPYIQQQLATVRTAHNREKFHCLKFRW